LQLIVAVLGIGVIVWQSWETKVAAKAAKKSAEATEKSVRLQEAALRQWVDIKEWRSVPWVPKGGDLSLHLQFNVVNPTDKPLTLRGVFIKIGEQEETIVKNNLIPPQKWHPIVMSLAITEQQMVKWAADKISLFVSGFVSYEDVLETMRKQSFSGAIVCSKKDGVIFVPPYGPGLYIASA
jgi:hypothetical protein